MRWGTPAVHLVQNTLEAITFNYQSSFSHCDFIMCQLEWTAGLSAADTAGVFPSSICRPGTVSWAQHAQLGRRFSKKAELYNWVLKECLEATDLVYNFIGRYLIMNMMH